MSENSVFLHFLSDTRDISPIRDGNGRLFLDRDPTHFRWVLNYLRDGYICSVPENMSTRAELLHEARFYKVAGLCGILEYQQPVAHQPSAAPNFDTTRPPTGCVFFFKSHRITWQAVFGPNMCKPTWRTIGMRFQDDRDEVIFMSLTVQAEQVRNMKKTQKKKKREATLFCLLGGSLRLLFCLCWCSNTLIGRYAH